MKIVKYKKNKNKYKVYFDNDENIEIYENIILKHNLLLKKELSLDDINKIKEDNKKEEIYDKAISYIRIKMRSKKEINNYLLKKEYNKEDIDKTIIRLEKEGYINDENYAKSYINDRLSLSSDGPNKVKYHLLNEGISISIIEKYINEIDIREKLERLIDKKIKSTKNYGGDILKYKIETYFINLGYDKEIVDDILSDRSFDNNGEKEYQKLYNKYSNKYDGEKLEYIIKQKLYQKGYDYNEIKKNID